MVIIRMHTKLNAGAKMRYCQKQTCKIVHTAI